MWLTGARPIRVLKGETLRDTAWTLEAMGADAVVNIVRRRGGLPGAEIEKSVVFNGAMELTPTRRRRSWIFIPPGENWASWRAAKWP